MAKITSSILIAIVLSTCLSAAFPTASQFADEPSVLEIRKASGSLDIADGPPLTFAFQTANASAKNWIGIYPIYHGGPVDQKMVEPSLKWGYITNTADGSLTIPADGLTPGRYRAFLLADDGYAWLAPPVDIVFSTEPISFPVKEVTLRNAKAGQDYTASVGGIFSGGGSGKLSGIKFDKTGGDSWIQVLSDGTIELDSQTMPDWAATGRATIEATGIDKSKAWIDVIVPARARSSALVENIRIMSYNLWSGGTQVNDYHRKQVAFLLNANVDIVGMQETTGAHATRLAEALGWNYWQGDRSVGIISRYPIKNPYDELSAAGGVRIALGEGKEINVWNAHLGYTPYGPYSLCFDGLSVDQTMDKEAVSGRTGQIRDTMVAMADNLRNADAVPVVLLGDFNAPSHLDWTDALKEKNCRHSNVPWPTSVEPHKANMADSFRVANPDPVREQGITWSPLNPFHDGATGRPEPQDRIDFIYYKGNGLEVLESKTHVVGTPEPKGKHRENEWTSDHAAVLTEFRMRA